MTQTVSPRGIRRFPNLDGLKALSPALIADHLKLYEGYVRNAGLLQGRLEALRKEGRASAAEPSYAEIVRRLGFEVNGVVLHELYFENLSASPAQLEQGAALRRAIEEGFGSFDAWLADFKAVALIRGIGWAILYEDPSTGSISNHWISEHEHGHPAGYGPILVLDAWEHAFVPDFKPYERARYVEAFLECVDWNVCGRRFGLKARGERPAH